MTDINGNESANQPHGMGHGDNTTLGSDVNIEIGGPGRDLFEIDEGDGHDIIGGFQPGLDRIAIDGFPNIHAFDQLSAFIDHTAGGNTEIDLSAANGATPGTQVLTVLGMEDLTGADFDFHPGGANNAHSDFNLDGLNLDNVNVNSNQDSHGTNGQGANGSNGANGSDGTDGSGVSGEGGHGSVVSDLPTDIFTGHLGDWLFL